MTLRILPLLLLAGCQFSMRALPGGSLTSSRSSPSGAATPSSSASMMVPDVRELSWEAASAALARAGHTGKIERDRNAACGSVHRGKIIERGAVCEQIPAPGTPMRAKLTMILRVQHQDPRHGSTGRIRWHLMPDVVGLPEARARQLVKEAGFLDANVEVTYRSMPGCAVGTVCRQYPSALQRGTEGSGQVLFVGADPAAPAPAASPAAKPSEPAPFF